MGLFGQSQAGTNSGKGLHSSLWSKPNRPDLGNASQARVRGFARCLAVYQGLTGVCTGEMRPFIVWCHSSKSETTNNTVSF